MEQRLFWGIPKRNWPETIAVFVVIMGLAGVPIIGRWWENRRSEERALHKGTTYGWLVNAHGRGIAKAYDYCFIANGDTFSGSTKAYIVIEGCDFGFRKCLGRRFRVEFSTLDPSNNVIDLSDEQDELEPATK